MDLEGELSAIFDPGKGAREAAAKSREQQRVANDRQLAQLRSDSGSTKSSRRTPRGRRLFADDGGKTNLS